MSVTENKALITRYMAAIAEDKSPATLDRFIAEEALKQHIAGSEAAFPGYRIEVDEMIAANDQVAVYGTVKGTHRGEFMDLSPTGRDVSFPLIIIYRIVEGKIVDHWLVAD